MTVFKKRVALFDVCNTLIGLTTITDFTENFLLSRENNPSFSWYKFFIHTLYKVRRRLYLVSSHSYRLHFLKLLKGYSEEDLSNVSISYAKRINGMLKEKTKKAFLECRQQGFDIFLVSGGLDLYLKPFAEMLGVKLICTIADKNDDGCYNGKILGIDCVGQGKVEKIMEFFYSTEIDWESSIAFGDSYYDIPMLELVGNPKVVDPDKNLEIYARGKGWPII